MKKELTVADQFGELRKKALDIIGDIMALPNDEAHFTDPESGKLNQAEHHKRLRMQLEAAQGIMSNAIRVDEGSMRHQPREDILDALREEIRAAQAQQAITRQGGPRF